MASKDEGQVVIYGSKGSTGDKDKDGCCSILQQDTEALEQIQSVANDLDFFV